MHRKIQTGTEAPVIQIQTDIETYRGSRKDKNRVRKENIQSSQEKSQPKTYGRRPCEQLHRRNESECSEVEEEQVSSIQSRRSCIELQPKSMPEGHLTVSTLYIGMLSHEGFLYRGQEGFDTLYRLTYRVAQKILALDMDEVHIKAYIQ